MQESTGRLSELRTERGGEKVHKKLFCLFPLADPQELIHGTKNSFRHLLDNFLHCRLTSKKLSLY